MSGRFFLNNEDDYVRRRGDFVRFYASRRGESFMAFDARMGTGNGRDLSSGITVSMFVKGEWRHSKLYKGDFMNIQYDEEVDARLYVMISFDEIAEGLQRHHTQNTNVYGSGKKIMAFTYEGELADLMIKEMQEVASAKSKKNNTL